MRNCWQRSNMVCTKYVISVLWIKLNDSFLCLIILKWVHLANSSMKNCCFPSNQPYQGWCKVNNFWGTSSGQICPPSLVEIELTDQLKLMLADTPVPATLRIKVQLKLVLSSFPRNFFSAADKDCFISTNTTSY